jgi:Zn-dependent protease with chaperone function
MRHRLSRRPDRGLAVLLLPYLAFLAYGVARIDAPVSLLGLVFDEPLGFAIVATVVALGGTALLCSPRVERRVARVFVDARDPTDAERARLAALLARLGEHSGMATARFDLRVQESGDLNAAAGGLRTLFVTTAALRRDDDELEALLAHELAHHRALHPVGTLVLWWLSLPGEALEAVYRALRRLAQRLTGRVRPLALLVGLLLLIWQVLVMWIFYVGRLLARWAARVSEYAADHAAATWGYGPQLAALYRDVGDLEPQSRLERLLLEHPPMPARIARLEQVPQPVGRSAA